MIVRIPAIIPPTFHMLKSFRGTHTMTKVPKNFKMLAKIYHPNKWNPHCAPMYCQPLPDRMAA